MRALRLLVRGLALAVSTTLLAAVCLLGLPVAALLGRAGAWRALLTQAWARSSLWALGARLEVDGDPPRGAFLLVSNHLSYVDVLVLASQLRCTFVSKAEIGSWPLLGPLSRLAGTIFVDRERRRDVVRVGERMRSHLDAGHAVVFFPEGTSTAGECVAPFRSSLLEPAAALGLPVRHATLRYATGADLPAARLAVAWWGDMDFVPHFLGLLQLPGFEARVVFGEELIEAADRKTLAARLHTAVASRFLPMLPDEEACLTSRTSPASS